MHARMHACASTFSGEVNAPINYLLNVPLNAMSLDFRANLFVPIETVHHTAFVQFQANYLPSSCCYWHLPMDTDELIE